MGMKLRRIRGVLLVAALIGATTGVIAAAREDGPAAASRAQPSPSPPPDSTPDPVRQDAIEPGNIG